MSQDNFKPKNFMTKTIQEIWDHMKRPSIRIIGIKDVEESQLKGAENISKIITEGKFSNLKKQIPIKVQEAQRMPNRLDLGKKKSPHHVIIKTLK